MTKEVQTKKLRNERSAEYYNKKAKDLEVLEKGDKIVLQPLIAGKKKWTKGTIRKQIDKRSYEVETQKGVLRRNRIHIRRIPRSTIDYTQRKVNANEEEKTNNEKNATHTRRKDINAPRIHTRRIPYNAAISETGTRHENGKMRTRRTPVNTGGNENTTRKALPQRITRGNKPAWLNNYVDK